MACFVQLREAGQADAAALDAFLAQYGETSMFLRGNLVAHGLGNRWHRHGTTYWLHENEGIVGVVGYSNGGYLMCQAPDASDTFWCAAALALRGRAIAGLTGVPEQVDAWINALDLAEDAFSVRDTDPLYHLPLDYLKTHDKSGLRLRRPGPQDVQMLAEWFDGFARDTGMMPAGGMSGTMAAEVFTAHDAARILERDGTPVAMTSLNAAVGTTVQVGGVYVSPAYRGRGLGGAIVATQLLEQRRTGVEAAILFAANAIAARGYECIGFRRIGSYAGHAQGTCCDRRNT
ncbi:GNAT family N-acetyltransferase [Sulfitobacter sp.]|uniref:GNAT family N-acetyltransferase n=1 Tax=Sulfitobacter sp. TaxID=1903071 RepID=UPI0030033A46